MAAEKKKVEKKLTKEELAEQKEKQEKQELKAEVLEAAETIDEKFDGDDALKLKVFDKCFRIVRTRVRA